MKTIYDIKSAVKVTHTKYVNNKSSKFSSGKLNINNPPSHKSLYEKFMIKKSVDKFIPIMEYKKKPTSCINKFIDCKNLSTMSTLKDSPFELINLEKPFQNAAKNSIQNNNPPIELKSRSSYAIPE